jgi:hypothetical protein
MINLSLDAEALVDRAESFKTFLRLNQPRPTDRFFLVTDMTGAGRTTLCRVAQTTMRQSTMGLILVSRQRPGHNSVCLFHSLADTN